MGRRLTLLALGNRLAHSRHTSRRWCLSLSPTGLAYNLGDIESCFLPITPPLLTFDAILSLAGHDYLPLFGATLCTFSGCHTRIEPDCLTPSFHFCTDASCRKALPSLIRVDVDLFGRQRVWPLEPARRPSPLVWDAEHVWRR